MLVITNLKDTPDGPTVQLPKNATMNATKTGSILLSVSLSTHAKKAHMFDGLHSASLISLGQMFEDDYISILDKNEINILKNDTLIFNGHRNKTDGLWYIPISRLLRHIDNANHHKRQNENIIDTVSSCTLLQPHPKTFPGSNKIWKFSHMERPQQSTLAEESTS